MWIPPLIGISIVLYCAAIAILVMNYYCWSTLLVTISFVMIEIANIAIAAHIYLSYGRDSRNALAE